MVVRDQEYNLVCHHWLKKKMYLPLGDVTNSTNLGYGRGCKRLKVESGLAPLFEEESVFTTCVVTQLFFSVPHHWLIIQQTSGLQCIFQINIGLPHVY